MHTDDEDLDPGSLNWTNPAAGQMDELEKRISQHPGRRLGNRLEQLKRVFEAWAGFSISFSELLEKCEKDDEFMPELIRNVGDRTKRQLIILSLDQATIAYTAGLGAVIDQSRAVVQAQSKAIQDEYVQRASVIMKGHPGGPFLAKLRNYVLHNVAAPWSFSGTFGEASTARVALDCASLLEDNKAWSRDAKHFIAGSGESIQLSPLIAPYLAAMVEHIGWIFPTLVRANAKILDDCDELTRERNLLLSGGVTDGHDWEELVAHMSDNIKRADRGEPQTDYRTGLPIDDHDDPGVSKA
ncbi:hypothetical protein E3O44_06050 [Cryobacterium algoricola]|uniref:Uncharacterized protein n=1 Tax=Cryobacterium algoricola TaxID=1259183 RepID=A0ABY2IGZ5_9MICO|nr:hypothetical protein [Cryobacterium algoricola]TFB88233.1 hypothetical protein E3O44_06050 [Cryobacterium algoricola]